MRSGAGLSGGFWLRGGAWLLQRRGLQGRDQGGGVAKARWDLGGGARPQWWEYSIWCGGGVQGQGPVWVQRSGRKIAAGRV